MSAWPICPAYSSDLRRGSSRRTPADARSARELGARHQRARRALDLQPRVGPELDDALDAGDPPEPGQRRCGWGRHGSHCYLVSRADLVDETRGYSALLVTVDSWTLGFRPADLERGNFPQFRGFGMENYYSDNSFTKHLAKPPQEDQAAALAHYSTIFAHPMTWEDLRWIRSQTKLRITVKSIQHADDASLAIDNGADVLYCTKHGGRQANSALSTLQLLPEVAKAAGSTPVVFDSGVRGSDGRGHRAGARRNGGRDRPPLRLRTVLRRRREPDPLPEVLPRRIRPHAGHLRIQGHRRTSSRPAANAYLPASNPKPVISGLGNWPTENCGTGRLDVRRVLCIAASK